MQFIYSNVKGLCVRDERGSKCVANFKIDVLGRTEDRISLAFTNRHGKRTELEIDAVDMSRPMQMRRHFLRKGNYHWSGNNTMLRIHLERLLERVERV